MIDFDPDPPNPPRTLREIFWRWLADRQDRKARMYARERAILLEEASRYDASYLRHKDKARTYRSYAERASREKKWWSN